jgi:hypothetical protein
MKQPKKEKEEPKGISIPLVPSIVLVVATVWVGFAIGCIVRGGSYIWLLVIAGAIVVGAITAYFSLEAAPEMHHEVRHIKGKITNSEHLFVEDYSLIYSATDDKIRTVLVKVANIDGSTHKVDISLAVNGQTPELITGVEIDAGVTADVEVPISSKALLNGIDSLSIELKQT